MSYSSLRQAGFTIIELLVVIVVIGILAAITIVAFNGVQQKAHAAVIASDLNNATKQLAIDNVVKGAYPSSQGAANNGAGLVSSDGTTYQYTYNAADNSYCLTATNGNLAYKMSSTDSIATAGVCPGHATPGEIVNGGVVTTLAGAGTAQGYADGPGVNARFYTPASVAVDGSGNVYVAGYGDSRIRKITPTGVVSTVAGSGVAGFTNGTGTSAQFRNPNGIAVDSSGNVYVADYGNNVVRKITSSGVVTTFAGSTSGYVDGAGASAKFNGLSSVAVDSSGNVYVADAGNNRIRKITSAGVVSTLAGSGVSGFADGTGTSAKFNYPNGIAVDLAGVVYVADQGSYRIRKITSAGVVSTLAGSGVSGFADGTGLNAQFKSPNDIVVDVAGNIYVADSQNNKIRQIK